MVTKKTAKKSGRKSLVKRKSTTNRAVEPELKSPPAMIGSPFGKYSDVTSIQHTKREFVFNFWWTGENTMVSSVITHPQHAKKILHALGKNIEKYEKTYGEIELD